MEYRKRFDIGLRHCVYLIWCPTLDAHKIGKTANYRARFRQLKRDLDPEIETWRKYWTPVPSRLERGLHRHFRHLRVPSNASDELFRLPCASGTEFVELAVEIERHVLPIEILHLETRLAEFLAEQQGPKG